MDVALTHYLLWVKSWQYNWLDRPLLFRHLAFRRGKALKKYSDDTSQGEELLSEQRMEKEKKVFLCGDRDKCFIIWSGHYVYSANKCNLAMYLSIRVFLMWIEICGLLSDPDRMLVIRKGRATPSWHIVSLSLYSPLRTRQHCPGNMTYKIDKMHLKIPKKDVHLRKYKSTATFCARYTFEIEPPLAATSSVSLCIHHCRPTNTAPLEKWRKRKITELSWPRL